MQYYGHPVGKDDLAAGGGGLTNWQVYQQGTDPNDFYNGCIPILALVSGSNQTASPNRFVSQGLVVAVADSHGCPLFNAPVTFTVAGGGGQLQASSSSNPNTSITVKSDYAGQAVAYFRLPSTCSSTCTITASAGSIPAVARPTFTEYSDDGTGVYSSAFGPSKINVTVNSDGSVDLSWVNNTDSTADIPIRLKQKDGTWMLMATVPAGTTSAHIPAP